MSDKKKHLSGFLLALLFFLFFLSGFSALVYQVIWQRMLGLFSGVDLYSATIIVSAFMLGMGCGTMAGGVLADKRSTPHLLALFAVAELLIGTFALLSKWLFYDVLYQSFPELGNSALLLSIVLFLSLLIPTFFMGLTLPLLSKALTRQLSEASLKIGGLYGVNTLGASLGAISSFLLIHKFGFELSLQIGAGLNLIVMCGALLLFFLFRGVTEAFVNQQAESVSSGNKNTQPHNVLPAEENKDGSLTIWMLVYAVSGFMALGLELLWLRLINVFYGSVSYTFSVIMFLYLLGLALGTFLGLKLAPKSKAPVRIFLLAQTGIALYAVLSVILMVHFIDRMALLQDAWSFLQTRGKAESFAQLAHVFILLPCLIIFPPTLLMGLSFPYLQQFLQNDLESLGRKVGWLQTANILGSTLGASFVGILMLGWFGTAGTLRVLFLLSVLYPLLLWRANSASFSPLSRASGYAFVVILYITISFGVPNNHLLWAKLHGTSMDKLIIAEDGSGVVAMRSTENSFSEPKYLDTTQVYLNGSTISSLPYGGLHTKLGLLPVMLHPNPTDMAIIGLGSGDTLFAAGSREEVRQITNIEIAFQQKNVLSHLNKVRPYKAIEQLLNDDRFVYVNADARTWLMRSGKKFDIIEADALYPNHAYSGNLYSREYFQLMKDHLKPGGFAASWVPTERTANTFRSVFPYILNISGWLFIGSNEPIKIDMAQVNERAVSTFTRQYFEEIGYDFHRALHNEMSEFSIERRAENITENQMNTDLYPRDEFLVAQ